MRELQQTNQQANKEAIICINKALLMLNELKQNKGAAK